MYDHRVRVVGECWEWTGKGGYKDPYGTLRGEQAHRAVYLELVGPIPEGMVIDHTCHNTRCVRPDHLRPVTHKQNMENRKGAAKNNRVGVRGVRLTRDGTYQVRVTHNSKTYCFGTFTDLTKAASVAKEARQKLHTHSDN